MKLSAEQFAELAASFDARQTSARHERRRAARLDLQAKIQIFPLFENRRGDGVTVVVSNFSARGLSLLQYNPMAPGSQFITELPRKGGGKIELLCGVVHSVPAGADLHRIGAEFICAVPSSASSAVNADEMKRISEKMMG